MCCSSPTAPTPSCLSGACHGTRTKVSRWLLRDRSGDPWRAVVLCVGGPMASGQFPWPPMLPARCRQTARLLRPVRGRRGRGEQRMFVHLELWVQPARQNPAWGMTVSPAFAASAGCDARQDNAQPPRFVWYSAVLLQRPLLSRMSVLSRLLCFACAQGLASSRLPLRKRRGRPARRRTASTGAR